MFELENVRGKVSDDNFLMGCIEQVHTKGDVWKTESKSQQSKC